ncbi:MAG: hypothetical protein WD451_11915, partial [Thermoanaerobaculia bacterium]
MGQDGRHDVLAPPEALLSERAPDLDVAQHRELVVPVQHNVELADVDGLTVLLPRLGVVDLVGHDAGAVVEPMREAGTAEADVRVPVQRLDAPLLLL